MVDTTLLKLPDTNRVLGSFKECEFVVVIVDDGADTGAEVAGGHRA